jgi:hypothetical protein
MCVSVGLVIQHAKRTRHIVICDFSSFAIFSTLSHNDKIFGGGGLLNNMCVVIFSKISI